MAQETQEIIVERREVLGRKGRSLLKKEGMIPAVVYGGDKDPVPISVNPKQIISILRSPKGANSVFLFALKGTDARRHVMIKDFQIEPTTNALIHADFRRISLEDKVRVQVPVKYTGIPFGVKNQGGMVDIILRDVEVECLPEDIPVNIPVDMTGLRLNDAVRISDLTVDEKVTILAEDKTLPLMHVLPPRVETEGEAKEEAEDGAEEGDEPVVIGKGKREEGEGEKKEE